MTFLFRTKYNLGLLLLLILASCVDPYEPTVLNTSARLLVVDGFINTNGPTTIVLSRTMDLDQKGIPEPEAGARVTIEEEGGSKFNLSENPKGTYRINSLTLNIAKRYRLAITTKENKSYVSDYVVAKVTPKIDDLYWRAENNGVQVYVNTQDKTGKTRYYRWDYETTYELTSAFYSEIEYANQVIRPRTQNINRCWKTENATTINLANSVRLQEDKIFEFPIHFLPGSSTKLMYKYSILVKQFAQTQEEYQYWETLRKNTENIGTLFDPLPTQLTGNIRAVNDPAEPVIGFIGAFSVETKRIFIAREELPKEYIPFYPDQACLIDTIPVNQASSTFNVNTLPVTYLISPMGTTIGYLYSSSNCVDCRLRGTNVKPGFWQ